MANDVEGGARKTEIITLKKLTFILFKVPLHRLPFRKVFFVQYDRVPRRAH